MKQSTVLLIALTPFACWGATAEEEALQQQLDQLRQQLIQQNQALHQLQARLEAVKATGTTAVAAEGAAAAAPSQPDPARRAPEVGRSTEDLMIEQHNVFDRALTLDFGLSYQHYNRKDLALRGFLALDAIFLGEINLDRVRSDQWTADLVTRYTLNDRWQLELAVPYMYRNTNYQSTGKENSSREFEEQTVSDGGLGDLSLAIYYRVLAEDEDWPDLVWNLRAKAPTGKDPYGIEIMTSESGNLMVPKDLATGNGLWQLSTGFSLVKTMDPAILFANLNYGHSLKQDFDDVSYQPGDQPGSIQLGDWYEYGLGVAFALNERFSLSFNINQRITLESSQGA
ncbi:MAG: transporter, partial [Aeromonadaceae bacterium]|nr:transporter [Aeromonadaceae bacterium]